MQIKKLTNDLLYMIRSMVTKEVYMHLINNESDVLCAWELDRVKRKLEPVGALVYSSSSYTYEEKSNEIMIESLYVSEGFRRQGIGLELLKEIEKMAAGMKGINGLCVNIPMPELKDEAMLFLNNGFEHRVDGNVIYRINAADINKISFFRRIRRYSRKYNALPFDKVSKSELNELYGKFDTRIPKWLIPETYGGKLQTDISFIAKRNEAVKGFLASSLYPNGELYLGGIYVGNKDGIMVAGLLNAFAEKLAERSDIKTILFAAATKEGDTLVKHILRDFEGEYWMQVVSDFYKKID